MSETKRCDGCKNWEKSEPPSSTTDVPFGACRRHKGTKWLAWLWADACCPAWEAKAPERDWITTLADTILYSFCDRVAYEEKAARVKSIAQMIREAMAEHAPKPRGPDYEAMASRAARALTPWSMAESEAILPTILKALKGDKP